MTVTNLSCSATIPARNGPVSTGFNGAYSGSNPTSTAFALNGVTRVTG